MGMKLAIVGGRDFEDWDLFCRSLEDIKDVDLIISGDCPTGADEMAIRWAIEHNIEYLGFTPNWDAHGKSAGPIRNEMIVKACDRIALFWDGQSKGTAWSLHFAKKHRRRYRLVRY